MLTLDDPQVPRLDLRAARHLLNTHFGLQGDLEELPSERDRNYKVTTPDAATWVLKVASPAEGIDTFRMQAALLRHVERVDPALPLPRLRPGEGGDVVTVQHDGHEWYARLVSFLPGQPMATTPRSLPQLRACGRTIGRLSRALRGFGHTGAHRVLDWDVRRTSASRSRLDNIQHAERRQLVRRALDAFDHRVAPRLDALRHSVVHGDPNDWNVLADPASPDSITGVIDFGDALFSLTIADLAIACAYGMMGTPSPLLAAAEIVRGFHAEQPIEPAELDVLPDLVRARLCTSLTIAAARRTAASAENSYWFVSEQPAWTLLERLDGLNRHHAVAVLRHACELEAAPGARAVARWIGESAERLAAVLERPLAQYDKRRLDWSDPRDPVVAATVANDVAAADRAYERFRAAQGFEVGIGAWGEGRAIYSQEAFASRLVDGARRSVHLGLDIFAEAGVELRAPLPARVVATADCNRPQDYGGVLLLEHRTGDGVPFRTLWGHLQPASLHALRPGQDVAAGDVIARLGNSAENGGWVPHLHLQIVCSAEDDPEAIIGVGEPELTAVWTELYPDPSALAGLPPETLGAAGAGVDDLLARRRALLPPNLSLSYRRPLHVVRGHDVWLVDASGRAYLDCYNNVAHVGHCHPRVVEAIARQAATLNTNTRYLNTLILEYAERLVATLPAPLSTCFFVCSGSEANELALRLARSHTGRREIMVLDWAYHGSTTSLVEISPYKYKRRGGAGRPGHVHEVPVPDPYRAPERWDRAEIGSRYAQAVREAIGRGARPGCFIAETIPSCAGQVFVPPRFFQEAFAAVSEVGGLCVLDEVQVGFGRVGASMWAFEEHGVVPDIVTMGKPIGNGHPLAAVVTTSAVAASFANGMEYFNTFGGNPVSCAAGLAVLDVLRDEGLPANASTQGQRLLEALGGLQRRHEAIGDVRGRGLFLGVELVTDRQTRHPATALASDVVNRCRDLGVLLGTDGPYDNVLKIRPPLTFRPEHADQLVGTLDAALTASEGASGAAGR